MKLTVDRTGDSQALLNIEVDQETFDKGLDRAYRRIADRTNIPGFRRGKAPKGVLERQVGRERILNEAVEILLPDVLQQALKEADLDPIANPTLDIVRKEPLTVRAIVPLEPTVQLGEYHDIREPLEATPVSEADMAQALERLREEHAYWVPVERPAQVGDLVTINASAQVGRREVWQEKGMEFPLADGQSWPAQGFGEELRGAQAGKELKFQLRLPANFPNRSARGQIAAFRVEVLSVKERALPELDEDLARAAGEYENLDALKEALTRSLQERAEAEAKERLGERVLSQIVDQARVELSPPLVDREVESLRRRLEDDLRRDQKQAEEYLRLRREDPDQLRASLRPEAMKRLKAALVLKALAKAEGIDVQDHEVEEEINRLAAAAGEAASALRSIFSSSSGRDSLRQTLINRKVRQCLAEIAQGPSQEVPATPRRKRASRKTAKLERETEVSHE